MSDFFLPEEIMPNIWLRLPIKSTVRFRCVSKSWCASLSDPHFIYENLTFFEAADEHDLLLLVSEEHPHYSVVSHETLLATPLKVPQEVPVPSEDNMRVLTPPCDDLVCFTDDCGHYIGVWNLTTGETKMVPRLVLDGESPVFFKVPDFGFGFDEKRKEYKIVQIVAESGNFVGYVYSLSSSSNNCWRQVGEPVIYDKDGGSVNFYYSSYRDGTFYWSNYLGLIVSFDMCTEVFNVISFPVLSGCDSSDIREICKLKEGSMFIITGDCIKPFESSRMKYELWALLEVGVSQSWIKLLDIDCCGKDELPYGIWRNELILICTSNGRLRITNPFKREPKEVHMDEHSGILWCLVWRKRKNIEFSLKN